MANDTCIGPNKPFVPNNESGPALSTRDKTQNNTNFSPAFNFSLLIDQVTRL